MAGTRRERARQQRLRRRHRLIRLVFVAVTVLVMMAPSLRAPADVPALPGVGVTPTDLPRHWAR